MVSDEMLDYVEKERLKREEYSAAFEEVNERQHVLQQQIAKQQALLHEQEKELNVNRRRIKEEQLSREKDYAKELRERERFFETREQELMQRQHQIEVHLHERMQATEDLSNKLRKEILEKEALLNTAYEELEREKKKYTEESRKLIESKSQNYVNTALSGLQEKEDGFHLLSRIWSIVGALSIFVGILFIVITSFHGITELIDTEKFSWSFFWFIVFRGLIVITMFIALARYAFIYSNSYMHESLKSGERRHAINFGKFYLEAFGANSSWEQIKEAFQHWNIDNESAFSKKQGSEFDPKIIKNAMKVGRVLAKNRKPPKKPLGKPHESQE